MKIAVLLFGSLIPFAAAAAEDIPRCEARCATEFARCRTSKACGDEMDMNCKCGDKEDACKKKCFQAKVQRRR